MVECDMKNRDQIVSDIDAMALRMRRNILDMALEAGAASSHFGGGLSLVEITATLYGEVMSYDPKNPLWEDRDRFILSKGHGVLGYYTALSDLGLISRDELLTFEKSESFLLGHPVINREKGIEFSNGSLGMGLSLGIGVAIAARKKEKPFKAYVVLGDGECNEGSVWEAAMSAAHFKLGNLVAILDRNRQQQTGSNEDIMPLGDAAQKFASFGWHVREVDGHDVGALYDALIGERPNDQPLAVIAHTVKGKGFTFSEDNNDWHHAVLTKSQYETALEELGGEGGAS